VDLDDDELEVARAELPISGEGYHPGPWNAHGHYVDAVDLQNPISLSQLNFADLIINNSIDGVLSGAIGR
jgi:hypothetical protein